MIFKLLRIIPYLDTYIDMPQATSKTPKQPKSAKQDLGYAKQDDLLALDSKNEKQHADIIEKIDTVAGQALILTEKVDGLAIRVINLESNQKDTTRRLARMENVIDKTYKLLDTHIKTQIRFDHELAASRNTLDRHEERIVALETK